LNFNSRHPDRLHVGMLNYTKRQIANKQGFAMLAPLWTDNDARFGNVYYHIYDITQHTTTSDDQARVKHAINHANDDVIAHGGVSVAGVTWVMVITWGQLIPRMHYRLSYDSPNTFQLVIAYDPSRYQTFATYIYKDIGWDNEYTIRHSMIGYFSYKYSVDESLQLAPSMKSTAFRLHTRIGNIGVRGRYMFRVASGSHEINYNHKCNTWFANEMKLLWLIEVFRSWTLVCPCDFRLAMLDGRWKSDYETKLDRRCIYERIPRGLSTQECCYTPSGSLINTKDGRGGQLFFFHPHFEKQHEKYDVLPKQWCCQFTDNCDYFYRVRPMDNYLGYTPLFLGWSYGDPHIHTLDGFQYTFNGLGEYTLVETTNKNFTLQGRTAKARDANGTETDATVFIAFAAKDSTDRVHIEMSITRKGLVVFVGYNNVTDWFIAANVTDVYTTYTDVLIMKKNDTRIEVTFKSGFTLSIAVSAEQLDVTVGAPCKFKNNTKGLMGVFNDDPNDDLLPPGEKAVPLSNNSSEKTIFLEFGEKCNRDAATATLDTNLKNIDDAATLSNASPNIAVDKVFNVTVGQDNVLKVNTSDPDGDTVTFTLESSEPEGAIFKGGMYTWKPVNMEPVNISFKASDGKEGVAAADVSINLCNCSGHGECLFDMLADGFERKQTFRIVQCNCSLGWEGDYCELDFDGCQDNPCTLGSNCTDLTLADQVASGKQYNCSACPEGIEDDDGVCLPLNECDTANPRHDCEHICINQDIGFYCRCNDGYRLMDNNKNCTDIDECDEATSGCEQKCHNTNGSFACSCASGYTLNTDNKTCTIVADMKAQCSHLNCSYGCKNGTHSYECFCQSGYSLGKDAKSCEDINECNDRDGGCTHNCTNFNGGFNCSCNDGSQLMNDKKGCKPCPSGTWGRDCRRDCNCRDSDTVCDGATGCAECTAGFEGEDCHDDIDECSVGSPCDDNANCSNTIGTFKCVCHAGFTQYNATSCEDLDECESDPCENGGECHNRNNGYTCTCMPGYNGTNCEIDIDECASSPCGNSGTCKDLVNRYRCDCARGFTGRHCEIEIAICDSNPCKNGGTCSQKAGKFACKCMPGYTGLNCDTEYDECTSHPCQNGGTCSTPDFNMFSCQCAPGYRGNMCETDFDECASKPCMNGGTCKDTLNGFLCNCASGYNGSMCNMGSMCIEKPCQNGGTCMETSNTRTCSCAAGYTGDNCETEKRLCASNPCQNSGRCSESSGSYRCRCEAGFTGSDCETDINECSSSPCQHGGICSMQMTDMFLCKCPSGYIGSNCETDIDNCKSSPCLNGGSCEDDVNAYKCSCTSGYYGTTCQQKQKIVRYYGRFRVPDLRFDEKWNDINTIEYYTRSAEVKMEV
ncbi:Mucin-like protein, partial [Lamellibrachia satsuma]